ERCPRSFSNFASLLYYLQQYKIEINYNNAIINSDGFIPIMNYLASCPNLPGVIKSLQSKNIMFLDQIISECKLFLLSWQEIKKKGYCTKGKIPFWYKFLKEHFTLNDSLRLKFDIHTPITTTN